MKTATLFEGIFVAFLFSLISSVTYFALSSIFSDSFLIQLLITGLSFAYILYLLSRSKAPIGRITSVVVWTVAVIFLWFFSPPISVFLLIHLLMIWLIRSLYYYSSLFSSLLDFALNGLSVATAFWAANHTDSLFLTIWCFFLIQTLFVLIPQKLKHTTSNESSTLDSEAEFQNAYRTEESAIEKLSIQTGQSYEN
jgi:hypothetical protein